MIRNRSSMVKADMTSPRGDPAGRGGAGRVRRGRAERMGWVDRTGWVDRRVGWIGRVVGGWASGRRRAAYDHGAVESPASPGQYERGVFADGSGGAGDEVDVVARRRSVDVDRRRDD